LVYYPTQEVGREEWENAMDKTVARLNIEHFQRKLATETDEARRQQILRLLAEEEAKLTALESPKDRRCR
jgi:hypothetical protein